MQKPPLLGTITRVFWNILACSALGSSYGYNNHLRLQENINYFYNFCNQLAYRKERQVNSKWIQVVLWGRQVIQQSDNRQLFSFEAYHFVVVSFWVLHVSPYFPVIVQSVEGCDALNVVAQDLAMSLSTSLSKSFSSFASASHFAFRIFRFRCCFFDDQNSTEALGKICSRFIEKFPL